jgi:hypothetical protein
MVGPTRAAMLDDERAREKKPGSCRLLDILSHGKSRQTPVYASAGRKPSKILIRRQRYKRVGQGKSTRIGCLSYFGMVDLQHSYGLGLGYTKGDQPVESPTLFNAFLKRKTTGLSQTCYLLKTAVISSQSSQPNVEHCERRQCLRRPQWGIYFKVQQSVRCIDP